MTLGELFEETYIQGEIAIRSYDSTGTTIEHYLGNAEEFYPDEHPQILDLHSAHPSSFSSIQMVGSTSMSGKI